MKCATLAAGLAATVLGQMSSVQAQASYKRDIPDSLDQMAKITEEVAARRRAEARAQGHDPGRGAREGKWEADLSRATSRPKARPESMKCR